MKRIELTRGKFTKVDDEDFEWLSQWNWYALKGAVTWYAQRSCGKKTKTMHRQIMNTPKGMDTDHKNGDGLDNRKCNLRICTRSQHHFNRKPKKGKYKGVNIHKRSKLWQVRITINGKRKSVGYYRKKEDAAKAYNKAAIKYYGEFARLNDVS